MNPSGIKVTLLRGTVLTCRGQPTKQVILNEDVTHHLDSGTKVLIGNNAYFIVDDHHDSRVMSQVAPTWGFRKQRNARVDLPGKTHVRCDGLNVLLDDTLEVTLPDTCEIRLPAQTKLQQADQPLARLKIEQDCVAMLA
jgi:hypothetical protein